MTSFRFWLSKHLIALGYNITPEGHIKECLEAGIQLSRELMLCSQDGSYTITISPTEEEETYVH